jgi:WD40 repeat protein
VTICRIQSIQTVSSDFGKKITYYNSLVEEKNLNIQILQDELQALQLELLQTDERVKGLESENQQLVQRWLSKVSETVEKLNAEVELTSPEQKPLDKIIKQTSMNRTISGLTTRADIILPHGEADTKGRILLFRGLESSQFLISPQPNDVIKTFISRDADLCIGIGNRDPDTAHIWSIDSGRLISNLSAGFGAPFIDLTTVSSTNDALVTLHNPNILRFYDLPRSFCMWTETLETFAVQLSSLCINNADLVATLLADGRLHLWDIRHRRIALKSPHQLPKFTSIATAGSSIIACTDRAVHVLDSVSLKILRTITHPALAPCSACPRVSIAGARFAIAAKSKIIYGNYTTGTVEAVLSNHQYDVTGVGWITKDERGEKCLLASADINGNLFLYDLQ